VKENSKTVTIIDVATLHTSLFACQKVNQDREYLPPTEGCVFNLGGGMHDLLKPKDATYPWATVTQAVYTKTTGRKIELADLTFEESGESPDRTLQVRGDSDVRFHT